MKIKLQNINCRVSAIPVTAWIKKLPKIMRTLTEKTIKDSQPKIKKIRPTKAKKFLMDKVPNKPNILHDHDALIK